MRPIHRRRPSLNSFGDWLNQHWFAVFIVGYGLLVWLPWLAPISMHFGFDGVGKAIYLVYSFLCHQLPERSFFLFGPKPMVSLAEVQSAWRNSINPFVLRQFVGSPALGWRLGWSDRMVSFYTSVWIFGVLWWPFRNRLKPLPVWAFLLLMLPMIIDGGSHAVSDIAGIGRGFRDSNLWLVGLTNASLPAWFYAGDALGSFNSWMRLVTGALAGLAIPWLTFPFVYRAQTLTQRLEQLTPNKALDQIKVQYPRSLGG